MTRNKWWDTAPPGWEGRASWEVPYEVREPWRERGERRMARENVRRFGLPYTPRLLRWTERGTISWGESDDGFLPAGSMEGDIHHAAVILDQFQDTDGRWYRSVKLGHETELSMDTLLTGAKADLSRLEERAHTYWKVDPSTLSEERAADEAEIDLVFQEEHLGIAREVAAKAALPEAERVSGAARDRAMRLGIDGSSDPRWTPVPWMSLSFTPGVEELEAYAAALHANAALLDVMIEEKLKERGEIEIAAKAEAAAKKAALEAAMAAPAGQVPWFCLWGGVEALQKRGRAPGEGFGLRVHGTNLVLPGDRSPVAIPFPGRTRRYRSYLSTQGLEALDASWGLPTEVGKQDVLLEAVVVDPAWSVAVRHTHDGETVEWELYTAEGVATLQAHTWDGEERWTFKGWDGEEGKGPSKAALRLAHGLAASKEEPPPPPAPLAVPATLGGLMGKWGKKRLAGRAAGAASLAPNFQHQPGISEVKEVQHMNQEHVLKIVRALGGLKGFVSADTMRGFEKEIPGAQVMAWIRVSLKGKTPVPGWTQTGYDPGEFEIAWADRGKQLKKKENGELGLLYGEDPEPWHYGVEQYHKVLRWEGEGLLVELFCDGEDADNEEERDRLPLRRSRGTSSLAPSKVASPAAISSRRRLDHAR